VFSTVHGKFNCPVIINPNDTIMTSIEQASLAPVIIIKPVFMSRGTVNVPDE